MQPVVVVDPFDDGALHAQKPNRTGWTPGWREGVQKGGLRRPTLPRCGGDGATVTVTVTVVALSAEQSGVRAARGTKPLLPLGARMKQPSDRQREKERKSEQRSPSSSSSAQAAAAPSGLSGKGAREKGLCTVNVSMLPSSPPQACRLLLLLLNQHIMNTRARARSVDRVPALLRRPPKAEAAAYYQPCEIRFQHRQRSSPSSSFLEK